MKIQTSLLLIALLSATTTLAHVQSEKPADQLDAADSGVKQAATADSVPAAPAAAPAGGDAAPANTDQQDVAGADKSTGANAAAAAAASPANTSASAGVASGTSSMAAPASTNGKKKNDILKIQD